MHEHSVREWFEEAVPIAIVLAVWNLLAAIIPWGGLSTPLRWTGFAIVLAYIVVRGWAHAEHLDPPSWSGIGDVVSTNVAVIKAGGLWFGAALVLYLFQSAYQWLFNTIGVALPGPVRRPLSWIASALGATGLAVAVIFLIAVAVAVSRHGAAEEGFSFSSGEGEAESEEASDEGDDEDADEGDGDDGGDDDGGEEETEEE